MATLTGDALSRLVAQSIGCTQEQAGVLVDGAYAAMRDALIDECRIEIRGFGSFSVEHAKARPGARNPRTGERIHVPPRRKVRSRPGLVLRKALSQQSADHADDQADKR